MREKEFYLYTYQALIEKIGEEKAEWYKKTFLTMYPKTLCVINGNLMKTYKED